MSQKLFTRKLIASSIAVILDGSLAAPLSAAENEVADNDVSDEENVVVITGIQATLKRNLLQKREAESIVDIVNSLDIGRFPDKNLAESLQRVPGVQINRGFAGEGNEVSIRGTDPELTQVLVNGQFVASTNWFSLSFNKRSFNMDLMPSELVSSIEVHKSPTASQDEGGVGGTVIINTRKPLEMESGKFFGSLEAMTNSLSNDDGKSFTGLYTWKNEDDTFGILGSFSRAETIGIGNKAENYWEEAWAVSGISQFRQNRERDTIDFNAQFAPTDSLSFGLHYFKTELDASNTNQNFLLFGGCCGTLGDGQDGSRGGSDFINGSGSSPTTGIPLSGTLTGGSGNPSWAGWLLAQDVNSRRPKLKSDIIDLSFDYSGESYSVSGSVGSTTADGGNGGNVNSLWGINKDDPRWVSNGGDLSVDFDNTLNQGMFINVNGLDLADPNWQTNLAASIAEVSLFDEEDWVQADADFDVDYGQVQKIKVGFKYRDHKFGKSQTNFTVDTAAIFGANATLGSSGFASGDVDVTGVL
ncbi:MAG: TonB-dependent receptor plug domain-containing protein, partial [Kangiellaceae bacterium]|nr:TonB-dependent receptor plug domain-containing protein [Kangiellaceae bacterium]